MLTKAMEGMGQGTPDVNEKRHICMNRFAAIESDDADDDTESTPLVAQLQGWAHSVKVKQGFKNKVRKIPLINKGKTSENNKVPVLHDYYTHALKENDVISQRLNAERPTKYLAGTPRKLST